MNRIVPSRMLRILLAGFALQACTPVAQAGMFDDIGNLFNDSDNRLAYWLKHPDDVMRWGDWDHIKLVKRDKAEPGEPNQHPVRLTPEQVAQALAAVQVTWSKETVPLFAEDEVTRLAPAIAGGLANARPDQDLVFLITGRHKVLGALGQKLSNSGRVFFADGQLQLIAGIVLSDALLGVRPGGRPMQRIEPGSRSAASPRVALSGVSSGTARLLRNDWIALSLAPASASPEPAPQAVAAQPPAPIAPAAPAPAVTPPKAPAAALDSTVQQHFSKQESRIRLLKDMQDKGLITESEYQTKRAEILKEL